MRYMLAAPVLVCFACPLADEGIVVEVENECGEEWVAQTVGAHGYNGIGGKEAIVTDADEWLSKTYCVSQSEHEDLSDIESELAAEFVSAAIERCKARALELGLADSDDTCTSTANLGWVGPCAYPHGCSEPAGTDDEADDGGSEDEAEGGTDESETGSESETDSGEEMTSETDALGLPPEAG
ncbi:hypothetical protein PPSIR1_15420 [Plesiocystis pacifica SIR-1]|uniref:Uncharacterized protein n=1 Tax=Plesiocystis pacifica SIR-1 TaxID=391625 RepID=A6GK51_9BACT|nr:hypothetical protein [Plesiocystis pacifica]EDM73750.1 hypothetical protein PPSIR1_15420 [Plesiocystis pacifica SIR-1]